MLASICSGVSSWRASSLPDGIADLGRAAAHQHDRPVSRLLQPAQHHDLDEVADVEARRGRVEADVGGDRSPSPPAHRAPRRRSPGGCSRARRAGGGGRICTRSCTPLSVMLSHAATAIRCNSISCPTRPPPPAGRAFKVWANVDHIASLGADGDDQHLVRRRRAGRPVRHSRAVGTVARGRVVADDLLRGLSSRRGRRRLSRVEFRAVGQLGGL